MKVLNNVRTIKTLKTLIWLLVTVLVMTVMEVSSLNGPNVCMAKQKYNITKRVKYRAPMAVRTYEWCFSMPPRCSRWSTEMRDLTRLESEERTAEMAVCCPGYKMKDVSCVPICAHGKTGRGCSEDCPPEKWGPNCVNDCKKCDQGTCSPTTGECRCQDGWQGERCESIMSTTASVAMMEKLLTSPKSTIATNPTTLPTTTATPTSTKVENTTSPISSTTSPMTTPTIKLTSQTNSATTSTKKTISTTPTQKPFVYNNVTQIISPTIQTYYMPTKEETEMYLVTNSIYYKTQRNLETSKPYNMTVKTTPKTEPMSTMTTEFKTQQMNMSPKFTPAMILPTTAIAKSEFTTTPTRLTFRETTKLEESRRPETIVTVKPTTVKFKPKEIWIRPAQKGESTVVETKVKQSQEIPVKHKSVTKKETTENTTPKTIVVSIIPTSVSYATFKKIVLSTASFIAQKNNITIKSYSKSEQEHTKPMSVQTTTPISVIIMNITQRRPNTLSTINPLLQNVTKIRQQTVFSTNGIHTTNKISNLTNSMSTLNPNKRLNSSKLTTTVSTTNVSTELIKTTTFKTKTTALRTMLEQTTEPINISVYQRNVTTNPITNAKTKSVVRKQIYNTNGKRNLTSNLAVTDDLSKDEETFHILTEPEHITAVMGDKGTERSSVDLISVISIAGGVMMSVITVAVIIVMLERCRKPRYEDVRKYNDIKMQVMINDNNDVPPPYVRSIFHTPLPDPPTSEKCHYQPISTLDRNLKQFMRPVVVQTISPLMLENFRGILECHYDHLPRRSYDMGTMDTRCSLTPSIEEREKLLCQRAHSLTDSDIEAMKCEAKQDIIDNTTSEPLYAEIPCWRPPSEHAIEVVNLNGEAVTEL